VRRRQQYAHLLAMPAHALRRHVTGVARTTIPDHMNTTPVA
jgi:hypothetical protein